MAIQFVTSQIKDLAITFGKLAGSIPDSKLDQITTGNKVAGSSIQLAGGGASGLSDSTGLKISALGVTDAMLAGSISFAKLADNANIARLDQAETVAAIWSFGANLPTASANPTGDTQLARKAYVDSVAQGLDIKDSCKIATTANISLTGTQTIDGVAIAAGQRVLVKDQSTAAQNGIYLCAAGAWSRSSDFAIGEDEAGAFTFIEQGTVNAESGWVCTNNAGSAVVGTDDLVFAQFSGAGQVIAGNGLAKSGNTLSVDLPSDAGLEFSGGGELQVKLDGNSGLNRVANGMSLKLDGATLSLGGGGIKIADSGVSNAQVSASAAIALSKLASINAGQMLVGPVGNGAPAAVALSGDATMAGGGAMTIANSAITTAKILNGAVDSDKMAALAIATGNIKDDAVTYVKMQNLAAGNRLLGSATAGVIGEVQVATAMIVDDAINNDKIADNAVQSPQIATSAVLLAKLGTLPKFERTSIANGTTATINLVQQISVANWRNGGNVAVYRNGQRLRYKSSGKAGLDQYSVEDNGSATRVDFGANLEQGDDIFITYIY